MKMKQWAIVSMAVASLMGSGLAWAGPEPPDSKRMEQAKDYIAEESWVRAVAVLKLAADDPKEPSRDEALFWLAHSERQNGDYGSAIQTIARLERDYPHSRWVRLAQSLRVEIAQLLRRDDMLWRYAQLPAPPSPPTPLAPPAPAPPSVAVPAVMPPTAPPSPVAMTPPPPRAPMPMPRTPRPARPGALAPLAPTPPPAGLPEVWWTPFTSDKDQQLEALAALMATHSERVIPLLRDMALDTKSPDDARRALFVLAHSQQPEARKIVVQVANSGAEPVRLAAIREIGRFDGPSASTELMHVYTTAATPTIKRQVVRSFGERADDGALFRIVKLEPDMNVRNSAIVTLGRLRPAAGQLRMLYTQAPADSREAVLTALFNAKDDDGLIAIARSEKDPTFRARARRQLQLLATPKAIKFLEENP